MSVHKQRHRTTSIDTTTTQGSIAFQLSDFPRPPLSVPSSPATISELPVFLRERLDRSTSAAVLDVPPACLLNLEPQEDRKDLSSPEKDASNQQPPVLPVPDSASSSLPAYSTSLSRHEGSSSIDAVDPAEEQLLSTPTHSLLSTRRTPRSTLPAGALLSGYDDGNDMISSFSDPMYPSIPSNPSGPHAHENLMPPDSAYWEEGRSSRSSHRSSETLHSCLDHNQSTVIRTASISRMGTKGTSVVGITPAVRMVPSPRPKANPSTRNATRLPGFGRTEAILDDAELDQGASATQAPVVPHERRQSCQSSKTNKTSKSPTSSVFSRLSRSQRFKPLPAVPVIFDVRESQETESRKWEQVSVPPQLAWQVDLTLQPLGGCYDFRHGTANPLQNLSSQGGLVSEIVTHREYKPRSSSISVLPWPRDARNRPTTPPNTKVPNVMQFSRVKVFLIIVLLTIIVVAVVVGIVAGRKGRNSLPNCAGNMTGKACDLDSTCVCSSSSLSLCVAQSLVTLTPTANQLFNVNFSTYDVAMALWNTQGPRLNRNCDYQAALIDVGSALSSVTYPNRTAWARSALLWQLVRTLDLSSVATIQSFINRTDFSTLNQDGPVADSSSQFNITNAGFVFDFAAQTVTEPAVSWQVVGQPNGAQISRVNSIASEALDRMYGFALASSTQQEKALINYWRSSLQQQPEDLVTFMSIVSGAPIIIPFDATISPGGHSIEALLTDTTAQFPPPIACYPSLDAQQLKRVNQVERGVFGLSPASAQSVFNMSCYGDRPIYGILDVLHLRLPFLDSRSNVSKQGALLQHGVSPRAVIYSGEILSALPHDPTDTSLTLDPRQYGTLNNFNHVMLQYLSSIPDLSIAISFVQFVLSSSALPPSNTSTLFESLSLLPALEVAVFGTVTTSDVSSTVSSFSTPSDDLCFGSDACAALRNWVITDTDSSIAWADSATAGQIVRDSSFNDSSFNLVWDPAFQYLHTSNPGVIVNVGNITNSFHFLGRFSP